jgi:hypothetical protein
MTQTRVKRQSQEREPEPGARAPLDPPPIHECDRLGEAQVGAWVNQASLLQSERT